MLSAECRVKSRWRGEFWGAGGGERGVGGESVVAREDGDEERMGFGGFEPRAARGDSLCPGLNLVWPFGPEVGSRKSEGRRQEAEGRRQKAEDDGWVDGRSWLRIGWAEEE